MASRTTFGGNDAIHDACGDRDSVCSGDNVSDGIKENYAKHLAEELQKAAQHLSLRTIKSTRIKTIQVAEIKSSL